MKSKCLGSMPSKNRLTSLPKVLRLRRALYGKDSSNVGTSRSCKVVSHGREWWSPLTIGGARSLELLIVDRKFQRSSEKEDFSKSGQLSTAVHHLANWQDIEVSFSMPKSWEKRRRLLEIDHFELISMGSSASS